MKILNWVNLAYFLVFLLFAIRFLCPSQAPFSHDESALQGLVEGHFHAGTFPTFGLAGTMGLHYGPVPQWIYLLFRYISGSPLAFVTLYAILFSTSFLFFALTLTRDFGRMPMLWAILLTLSSPWIFIYSRLPWDNSFLVIFSAILVFLVSQEEKQGSPLFWIFLGIVIGAGLSTHLMFAPLAASAGLFSLRGLVKSKRTNLQKFSFLLLAGIFALLVNIPYIRYLLAEGLAQARHKDHWGNLRQSWWIFLKSTMYLGTWNLKFFFYPYEAGFFQWLHPISRSLFHWDIFTWILKAITWFIFVGATIAAVWQKLNHKPVFHGSSLYGFVIVTVFLHFLLLQYLDINIYPHYFMAIWWFPFWAVAFAVKTLSQWKWAQKYILIIIAGTIATNLLFLAHLQAWTNVNAGTRGDFFPSVVGEQYQAVREICSQAKIRKQSKVSVDISAIRMDSGVFAFFPQRDPSCQGIAFDVSDKKIEVGSPIPNDLPKTSSADYIIMYDQRTPYDAHLKVFGK